MNNNDDSETRVLDDSTQLSPPQGDEDKTRVIRPGLPLPDDTQDLPTRLVLTDGKSVSGIRNLSGNILRQLMRNISNYRIRL